MPSLNECKNYVILHAKTLNIGSDIKKLLPLIDSMSDDSPNSWARIFIEEAKRQLVRNDIDKALGYFNIARFPYADTVIQKEAYKSYLSLFQREYIDSGFLEIRRSKDNKTTYYYKKGNSKTTVIICGGIISLKEQWIKALKIFNKFGCSVLLYEMPGVGENTERYDNKELKLFSHLIDELDLSDDCFCHVIGISFSGYFALKDACTDIRITSITMIGTPLSDFFHDHLSFNRAPDLTKETLTHLVSNCSHNVKSDESLFNFVDRYFPKLNITRSDITIYYLQSKFDEIISMSEISHFDNKIKKFYLLSLPDKHGSPRYHKVVFLFVVWSLSKTINANFFIQKMLKASIRAIFICTLVKNKFTA